VRLRKDMWSSWAQEVTEAAVGAQALRPQIDASVAAEDWDELTLLVHRELRYGMRAITGTAFAIDAFYASVKARAGAHPDEATWKAKPRPVPRHVQVFETLRFHLKLRAPGANDLQRSIQQFFGWRGAAVHPGGRYREPVVRDDLNAAVDWHFVVFRVENAVSSASAVTQMLDIFVDRLARGKSELRDYQGHARTAMDAVLDEYEGSPLPPVKFLSRGGA
jgi:hypothetical protein